MFRVPFCKSAFKGFLHYYSSSRGNLFTEEQFNMSNELADALDRYHPVEDLLDLNQHFGVCKLLSSEKFREASDFIGDDPSNSRRAWCVDALKIGLFMLSQCTPRSVRDATFNLIGCDRYFHSV